MKTIEQSYLNNLVQKTSQGSSNAFAELAAAVYRRHYSYLFFMLHDDDKVIHCLKAVYVQVLHHVSFIGKPDLYMPWSCRICYHICQGKEERSQRNRIVRTPAGQVTIFQLYHLPLTESQIMIMRYGQKLSVKAIGTILNLETNAVRKAISSGVRHLRMAPGRHEDVPGGYPEDQAQVQKDYESDQPPENQKCRNRRRPDVIEIQEILDEVFEMCGKKSNSVPVEALFAYSEYRKERFSLQKGILIAAMIFFLLLPVLFIAPAFELHSIPMGERGLPVVTIDVEPRLPVNKVLADVDRHSLPVYEAGAFQYTVEPIRNGTLSVEVELINRQSLKQEYEMEDVDTRGPELIDSSIEQEFVKLIVRDAGIGIDYRGIYAQDQDGLLYYPVSCNEETGEIVFSYPDRPWDVYIPDHLGNRLHLSFVFE